MIAPCKGCETRTAVCHATCEAYKEWNAEQAKMREASRPTRLGTKDYNDYQVSKWAKYKHDTRSRKER